MKPFIDNNMKIVINICYGGFGLSQDAKKKYMQYAGINAESDFDMYSISRNDKFLVKVVEELKNQANEKFSSLKIVEIPDDIKWVIEDYDGLEWVAEEHRKWS